MMPLVLGDLTIARFTADDTADLHRVRNHDSVRPFMADPRPIPWERHVDWVRGHLLERDDLALFMVRERGQAIGFTLLKRLAPDTAEIGEIFADPDRHALAATYAAAATVHQAFEVLALDWLVSWVVPGHRRAFAINAGFGAWEVPSDKPGMIQFRLSREAGLASKRYRKILARLHARAAVSPS